LFVCYFDRDVRKAALSALHLTRSNLPHMLARARDSAPDVRRRLFAMLLEGDNMRLLSIQQRVMLMRAGLKDRDAAVVRSATQLLCTSWVKKTGYNLIELLKLLGVEHFPEDAEYVLRHVLKNAPAQCAAQTPRPPYAMHQLGSETV
jgi:hypothetical protein